MPKLLIPPCPTRMAVWLPLVEKHWQVLVCLPSMEMGQRGWYMESTKGSPEGHPCVSALLVLAPKVEASPCLRQDTGEDVLPS